MFIELTDKSLNDRPRIYINANSIVCFYSDGSGGTHLRLSRENQSLSVLAVEEPGIVWARIHAVQKN